MSDEDYDVREKSYRAFKREKLAADPNWKPPHLAGKTTADTAEFNTEACVMGMEVGMRCSVAGGDRRGTIKYIGSVEALGSGYWIGVQFDEPLGRHDGALMGKRYFDAPDKYASFLRPTLVTVGDFKPLWEEELGAEIEQGEAAAGVTGASVAAVAAPAAPAAAARKPKRRDEIDDDDDDEL
jgi:tubulin-folding cofactor B